MGQLIEPSPERERTLDEAELPTVCRMGRWCSSATEATSMLDRLKERGWRGAVRQYDGLWHVDVARPFPREQAIAPSA